MSLLAGGMRGGVQATWLRATIVDPADIAGKGERRDPPALRKLAP